MKTKKLILATMLWLVLFSSSTAMASIIPLSAVSAEFEGIAIPLPDLISVYHNFKVNVSNIPPLDPLLRLTDFRIQFTSLGLDNATISWSSAPGWKVSSVNNLAGEAFFEALSVEKGIAPGNSLSGFDVRSVGYHTELSRGLTIEEVSYGVIPEPATIALLGLGGLGLLRRRKSA